MKKPEKKSFKDEIKEWSLDKLKRAMGGYEDARTMSAKAGNIHNANKAGDRIADIASEIERRSMGSGGW